MCSVESSNMKFLFCLFLLSSCKGQLTNNHWLFYMGGITSIFGEITQMVGRFTANPIVLQAGKELEEIGDQLGNDKK